MLQEEVKMDSIIPPVSMKTFEQDPNAFAQELGKWFETYGFAVVADLSLIHI